MCHWQHLIYCVFQKKRPRFYFLNIYEQLTNFNNYWLKHPEVTRNQKVINLPTLPISCCCTTLGSTRNDFLKSFNSNFDEKANFKIF